MFRRDAAGKLRLAYHGQYDSSRPGKYSSRLNTDLTRVTGEDLRRALDSALEGQDCPAPWKPAIGCNLKWTPGNEPAWYGATTVNA